MKSIYKYYKYRELKFLNDEELYNLVADNTRDSEIAFTVLYDRYSKSVWQYCYSYLGESEHGVAKDILQETFIRFYKEIKKNKPIDNLLGILLADARNLCDKHISTKLDSIPYTEEEYPDYSREDNTELLALIKYAVSKLPPLYREALILREYQGLSYLEIQDLTGESMSNVKVRIHRAKAKVREVLQHYIEEMQKEKAI